MAVKGVETNFWMIISKKVTLVENKYERLRGDMPITLEKGE